MADKANIYNLKAVVNEVGLSPATLRAWERRYGLLRPQRSAGGHRLYSRRDIEMLKWLVERQKQGLSISQAVEMWKGMHGNDQEELRQFHEPASIAVEGATLLDGLRQEWLSACLVFDDQAANQVLNQAFAIAPPETVCIEVLQKGLAEMGDRWYAGAASVQHEHFASNVAARRFNALLAAVILPYRVGRILVACPPGEEHSLVLLLVSYLLRRQGWDVIYLGADVPLKRLDDTIRTISPTLVLSAAQTLPGAASLRWLSEMATHHRVGLAYGGGIFDLLPAVTQRIAGFYLGNEIAQVPYRVENLIAAPPPLASVPAITPEYVKSLATFQYKEALIQAQVMAAMQGRQLDALYQEVASTNLPRIIQAGLSLGDIQLLEQPLTWLDGLLINLGHPTTERDEYYRAYTQALEDNLGGNGAMIIDFLRNHILSG